MKLNSILSLSWKNLWRNISRSILTIVSITILSCVIITLANFCYYYKTTCDESLLKYLEDSTVNLELRVDTNNDKLAISQINKFLDKSKNIDILQEYEISTAGTNLGADINISLKPYIAGIKANEHPQIISGSDWIQNDIKTNDIFISKTEIEKQDIEIGDEFEINSSQGTYLFTVKGIVDDNANYIDYTYFNINGIKVIDTIQTYNSMEIIYQLDSISKDVKDNGTTISGNVLNEYNDLRIKFVLVFAVCAFLIIFCIAFSLSNILNILKISIEHNNTLIVIMKSFGMRFKHLFIYIFLQMFILILLSTIIATSISATLAYLSLETLLDNVLLSMDVVPYAGTKSGFNFLLAFINIAILLLSVLLGSFKMLNRFLKKDVAPLMSEVR